MYQPLVATTGDWVAASFGGTLPSPANDVVIPSGVTITLTAPTNMAVKSLNGAGSLVVPVGAVGSTLAFTEAIRLASISGTGGTVATATAALTNGALSISAFTGGTLYANPPKAYAVGGTLVQNGYPAVLDVQVSGGAVTAVNVVSPGNYTTGSATPTIVFVGGNEALKIAGAPFPEMNSAGNYSSVNPNS